MGLLLSTRRAIGAVAAWTPDSLTAGGYSPEHWYRSDSGLWQDAGVTPAVADGDPVGRWEDKATNADHVNQAGAPAKPSLQNGAADLLNGHPVLRFDGAFSYLQGAFTNGGQMNQPNTVFAVAALDAASVDDGANRPIMDGDDVNRRHILGQVAGPGGTPDDWRIYAATNLGASDSDSNWNVWTAVFNGVASQLWHGGVAEVAAGDVGAFALDGLTIGGIFSGATVWDGDIVEIILYDANLPNADKNQVGRYLARRYGLSYTNI